MMIILLNDNNTDEDNGNDKFLLCNAESCRIVSCHHAVHVYCSHAFRLTISFYPIDDES